MSEQPQPAVFVGLDVGKSDHHAVAVTSAGKTIYDKALPNEETRLRAILEELAATHGPVLMIVDQPATIGALPVAVAGHRQDRRPRRVDHRRGRPDHAPHPARHPGR